MYNKETLACMPYIDYLADGEESNHNFRSSKARKYIGKDRGNDEVIIRLQKLRRELRDNKKLSYMEKEAIIDELGIGCCAR